MLDGISVHVPNVVFNISPSLDEVIAEGFLPFEFGEEVVRAVFLAEIILESGQEGGPFKGRVWVILIPSAQGRICILTCVGIGLPPPTALEKMI